MNAYILCISSSTTSLTLPLKGMAIQKESIYIRLELSKPKILIQVFHQNLPENKKVIGV